MAKETLVDRDVNLGTRILGLLDEAKFPVPVALWIRREDEERWKLLFATPLYDRLGPLEAYHKLVVTLGPAVRNWVDFPVQLETTRQPLIRELRKMYRKGSEIEGERPGGRRIGGTWVDDAYVYRIR